jgi:hypothetical protein
MVVVKPACRMCVIQASQHAQVGVLKTVRFLVDRLWAQAVPVRATLTAAPKKSLRWR